MDDNNKMNSLGATTIESSKKQACLPLEEARPKDGQLNPLVGLKNKTRKGIIKENLEMNKAEKVSAEFAICENLLSISKMKDANRIALYNAIEYEVDLERFISKMLEGNKILCFPRFNANSNNSQIYEMAEISNITDLVKGKYDILEPGVTCQTCDISDVDIWLIPGVAFDHNGVRLGRGGGVYDRLLNKINGLKVGVLFNTQLKNLLPSEEHDIKMDVLVTEDKVIDL